jgi:hypothetical protein
MRPKIINTFTKAPTKALAKQLNLTFDKKFGYCTSDAYNDDKGYPIPTYITINFEVYGLKYFDGCFNPFLVQYSSEGFSFTSSYSSDKPLAIFTANYTPDAIDNLRKRFPKLTN